MKLPRKIKGKNSFLEVFKSFPPMDIKDAEVNPLHVIFDLKRVFVGKEYFRISHLLLPPFDLVWGPILLGKNVVPRPALKEFLLRCLK